MRGTEVLGAEKLGDAHPDREGGEDDDQLGEHGAGL
jgi:hypothetical protein